VSLGVAVLALTRASLLTTLRYRASFVGEAVMAVAWAAWTAAPLFVVFGQAPTLAGWTAEEALAVMGFFIIAQGALEALVDPNLRAVVEQVRQGTFDFVLLKPLDAQLYVSLHRTEPLKLVHCLVGLGVVGYAARAVDAGAVELASAALLMLAGLTLLHSLWTIVVSSAFFFVKVDNLSWLIRAGLDAGRWPVSLYRGLVRFVLTFVLPIGLVTTYPALALRGELKPSTGLGAMVVAVVFGMIARLAWTRSLRRYSSASS
jgi:ABC-2 type transport system permease protein